MLEIIRATEEANSQQILGPGAVFQGPALRRVTLQMDSNGS